MGLSRANGHEATDVGIPVITLTLAALFIMFLPFRAHQLWREPRKVKTTWHAHIKACASIILALCNLGVLVNTLANGFSILSAFATGACFATSLGIVWLSFLEHRKSVRPSDLIVLYLGASLFCDILLVSYPRTSTQRLERTSAQLFIAKVIFHAIFFLLECRGKEPLLLPPLSNMSPEETAGFFNRRLSLWVNDILFQGSKKVLHQQDLPQVPRSHASLSLRRNILRAWDQRGKPAGKWTLFMALLRSIAKPFCAAIIPRLLLIAFRYSQPVLIREAILFVNDNDDNSDIKNRGFWLLVSAFVVYVGLAISTTTYTNMTDNLEVMSRGAIVNMIYSRLLLVHSDSCDSGAAVTLMSTDADSISSAPELLLDMGGYTLEVIVGMTMLYTQVRWLWFVTVIFIIGCSRTSNYVAKNLKPRQRAWVEATQQRVAVISDVLGLMKSVKALGLSTVVKDQIRSLRENEIAKAKRIQRMQVIYVASANALGIFTPPLMMILYSLVWHPRGLGTIDAETAFTTIALLVMVTHPANMVMTVVPKAIACSANFDRVQSFLLESTREDHRTITSSGEPTPPVTDSLGARNHAIRFKDVTVRLKQDARPILQGINLDVTKGRIVACFGAVGSGKSTLGKVILGEVPVESGTVNVAASRIGYCSQTPWLPEGTIRDVVCGFDNGPPDVARYEEAMQLCRLDHDLRALQDGNETSIGSRGMNLSGGQKQRIALARLVYARREIAVLDSPFSSLDLNTAKAITRNLLGEQGFFRKQGTTVFWIDSHASLFPLADHVVFLENSTIQRQGPWEEVGNGLSVESVTENSRGREGQDTENGEPQVKANSQKVQMNDVAADLERKTGDLSLYGVYVKHSGVRNTLLLLSCTASYSLFITFPHYWLRMWTEADANQVWHYIVGYVLFAFTAWGSTCGAVASVRLLVVAKSGLAFHQMLLDAIMGAPLSFFSATENGVTLNRFSQDIALVDSQLPSAVLTLVTQIFKLLVQVSLLFTVQRFMLFTLPPCIAIIWIVQNKYLQTSRQLRFLELESRSGMFTSFVETVEGLVTLRAFGWQRGMDSQALTRIDESQTTMYALYCVQRWLGIVIDLTMAGIAIVTIALAVALRGSTTGGDVGVALNVVLVANGTLLNLVRGWTSVETSLGAVSRVRAVQRDTPVEGGPDERLVPLVRWPEAGDFEIKNLQASYGPGKPALDGVSLRIPAGQKLVICGRTGSGKSTFILALLHMVEYSGSIKIDRIDASKVPRGVIRERCLITIPQDAFVMASATLRANIDPTHAVRDDETLARALEKVRLFDHLTSSSLDPRTVVSAILNTPLSDLPVLSHGQTQLLALARALVKREAIRSADPSETNTGTASARKPALVLDEATSSLDPVTEAIIHDVIDEEFVSNGHTVIIVTHRPANLVERMRPGKDAFGLMRDGKLKKVVVVDENRGILARYSE